MTPNELKLQLSVIARNFRLGLSVDAALALSNVMGALISCASAFSAASQIELSTLVAHILQCQESRDWLGLADYLEYELADLLDGK